MRIEQYFEMNRRQHERNIRKCSISIDYGINWKDGSGSLNSITNYLIERNDEGSLPLNEQLERFDRLRFQAVHDIDDQNGQIAE